ncbi:hypothetical protein PN498_21425 [Oscillatoria sp. CS-180]|uniref:hypothetical protein n=1 Tax=Oscillatoria sp. CS-180 TaxID=3021720 RepID=UPI00232EC916|nr:hypothetical protein [Oscillatoria sp. CS-180]MDB9528568.1 hypothetical protein [Oscillatoria sp. CS-180]
MAFFRSYIAPLLIVLTFLIAMLAVSARIFLPNDMMAPAPIEEPIGQADTDVFSAADDVVPDVSWLIQGLPDQAS